MKERVKVSICIPVFNMAGTIERAVRSGLTQSFESLEILVIDNGSNDGTYEIVSAIEDTRLLVIRNERKLGAYGTHNKCLELASGKWVKFLHGDDDLEPNAIRNLMAHVDACQLEVGLVCCPATKLSFDETLISVTDSPKKPLVMKSASIEAFMLHGNFVGTPSMVMLNRTAALEIGGFDLTLNPFSDGDMWMNMRSRFASLYVPDPLVNIRDDHPGSRNDQVQLKIAFMTSMEKQIHKWHGLSREKYQHLSQTSYSDWMMMEMHSYVISSFYYLTKGQPQLLFTLLRLLCRNRVFYKTFSRSLKLFFTRRNHMEIVWFVALSDLAVETD
jgi:glycosyltransferase involved in cell wall biosynthesis